MGEPTVNREMTGYEKLLQATGHARFQYEMACKEASRAANERDKIGNELAKLVQEANNFLQNALSDPTVSQGSPMPMNGSAVTSARY